jgi:hypothetical protein
MRSHDPHSKSNQYSQYCKHSLKSSAIQCYQLPLRFAHPERLAPFHVHVFSWLDTAFLPNRLVVARTAPAPTADALNLLVLLQLFSGHAADACAVEVGLLGLDASQAAQLLKILPVSTGAQL